MNKEADVIKFYEQKGIPIPAGTEFSDKKGGKKDGSKSRTKNISIEGLTFDF